MNWNNADYTNILSEQLINLANYYLDNPQIKPCNIINMGIEELYKEFDNYVPSWCGAGKSMVAYDVSGNSYPCQYFMPLSIGTTSQKIKYNDFKKLININKLNEDCRNCILRNLCPTCFGANYMVTGNMYYKEKSYCNLLKVQFKASAYLMYNRICRNQLTLSDEEKYKILKGIEMVQSI